MLDLVIPSQEYYNEESNEFFVPKCISKDVKLKLEHSLLSISKWESTWKKPFLTRETKSLDEIKDYIKCMTLTQNVNPEVYDYLTNSNIKAVNDYIEDPMSATTFREGYVKKSYNNEQPTSELIYYWMIALNIPMECQKWHLNRLLTLIRVCNIKNSPQKKMSKSEILAHNKKLNDERKIKYNTKG